LASFDGTNGAIPEFGVLVQGRDGNLYGATRGPAGACSGTTFKITTAGKLTSLHCFGGAEGEQPYAGLVLGTNGAFYGAAFLGGANTWGTVFKMTSKGKVTPIYSFCAQPGCTDGVAPFFGPVEASDGKFYGTTPNAPAVGNQGTIFKVTAAGKLTTLLSFDGTNGADPSSPVLQAADGSLYGTTGSSAAFFFGTLYKITTKGAFTTLHGFTGADGFLPAQNLAQAPDGNIYGTTYWGGVNNECANGCGTAFQFNPTTGTFKTIYNFCTETNCADGSAPNGVMLGSDGNLYGTTQGGGNAWGTVFELTPAGALTTLYAFCAQTNCIDGSIPQAGLLQATNGTFYGVTTWGGASAADGSVGDGTVFSVSVGLGPFVSFVNKAAKVGQTVQILGQGLQGTSAVSFNGTPANFSTRSANYLTANVPSGATTGYVTVITPGGTLTSNVPFQVVH
jgi:uncharacterized repeat protein (TIGR03803 family)